MPEIKDIFVGQFGIVATVKTNAVLSDATATSLEIEFPKINFTTIAYDDSELVKYTDESNKANGIDKDDISLLPTGPIQVEDAYYIGSTGRVTGIDIEISQDGVGSWVLAKEYWNGTVWGTFSNITDGTNDFMDKGLRSITWDLPVDWATIDINDQTDELYFMRFRVTTADADPTQQPLGKIITLTSVSLTGSVTNPSAAISTDANFGEFTVTIPDATFEFLGTYSTQSKVTTASGLFFGKVSPLPIKPRFGQ